MTDNAIVPIQDIERMGVAFAKSQLFGMKTAEQAIALMLVAQAQGRHPASVAMEYDVIQGKPALKSQAALIRFQEAGGKIKYIKRTDAEVTIEFSHPAGGTVTVTWNMERAKKMGFAEKDNWKKQPMIMLQWRCIAEGVRACYPACLGGSYLVEEVQDFEPAKSPRDITPIKVETTMGVAGTDTTPLINFEPAYIPPAVKQAFPDAKQEPAPPSTGKTISEKQAKRLFAIAHGAGWSTGELKEFLISAYDVEHTKDIKMADYEAICEKIQSGAPMPNDEVYQGELG